MTEAPTSVYGRAIYTDPPEMALRPRGAIGMMWWEEASADDPEAVHFVLKSRALPEPGSEEETKAVERMRDAVNALTAHSYHVGYMQMLAAIRALREGEE